MQKGKGKNYRRRLNQVCDKRTITAAPNQVNSTIGIDQLSACSEFCTEKISKNSSKILRDVTPRGTTYASLVCDTVQQRAVDTPLDPPRKHVRGEGDKYNYSCPSVIYDTLSKYSWSYSAPLLCIFFPSLSSSSPLMHPHTSRRIFDGSFERDSKNLHPNRVSTYRKKE